MNDTPRSEQSITDDEKTRFLVELMLTNRWDDEFEMQVRVDKRHKTHGYMGEITDQRYYISIRFCDYMHHLGLIRYVKSMKIDHVFEVSVLGKKFLDKQKGEKHEQ